MGILLVKYLGNKSTLCVKDAVFYCAFFIIHLILHGWLVTFCLFCCVREEEREDLDTSTESKEMERKEQDMDTVTEDEEELGPNRRRRRGNAMMNLCVYLCTCMHARGKFLCFIVDVSILAVIFF